MAKFRPGNFNKVIIFLFGIVAALYFASTLLIPLTWGIFLAALLRPITNKMEEKGMSRKLSTILATLITLLVAIGLFYFVFSQSDAFIQQFPQMQAKIQNVFSKLQEFVADKLGVEKEKITGYIQSSSDSIQNGLQQVGASAASNMMSTLLHFLLVMVYLFLLLLKREKYQEFILRYFKNDKEKAKSVTKKAARVAGEYLWGRLKVMVILGTMYVITFLAFGIPGALLLTVIATIITVIPYIGAFLSGLIPIIVAFFAGMDFTTVLILSIVVIIIQLIESYVLEPVIMGSEVHLSPITIIIAIIAGDLIWGVSGMILFVPIFSVSRIIFAEIDELKPLAFLIGDDKSGSTDWSGKIQSLFKKKD